MQRQQAVDRALASAQTASANPASLLLSQFLVDWYDENWHLHVLGDQDCWASWRGGHAGGRRGTDRDVGLNCSVGRQVVSEGRGAGGGQGTGSLEGLHEGHGGCTGGQVELFPTGEFLRFLLFHPLPVPE